MEGIPFPHDNGFVHCIPAVYRKIRLIENEIVRGGVYAANAAIFMEGNPISRKKNRLLAFFSCARRARLKNGEGRLWRGNGSPSIVF